MDKREKQVFLSAELFNTALIYKQMEDKIYNLLKEQCVNLALITESLGMKRQTAYYKLKHRGFSSVELDKIARKATEIYKIEL